MCAFERHRIQVSSTLKVQKKEIYGSRSHSASPSGNGNAGKVGESLQSVFELALESQGPKRTAQLLEKLMGQLNSSPSSSGLTTPYLNTIPPENQPPYPGDWRVERRIKSLMRWNAMAMVVKANSTTNVGGHISTYASAATLYEVGFNHFFRGATENFCGDIVYFQGHASPGIMRELFSKAGWTKSICKISGRNWPMAAGCHRIRIRI